MADMQKLIDELSGLTVLEAAELVKALEAKWGVSAAAPVAAMAAMPAGGGNAPLLFQGFDQLGGFENGQRAQLID